VNAYLLTYLLNGCLLLMSLTRHCFVNNKQPMVPKKEDKVLIKLFH